MPANDELTISEVAKMVGVSRQAIDEAVDRGTLPHITRRVTVRRVLRADAEAYAKRTGGTGGRPRKAE